MCHIHLGYVKKFVDKKKVNINLGKCQFYTISHKKTQILILETILK